MKNEEKTNLGVTLPCGLNNMQNTCYLNSILQCLRVIPELSRAVKDYSHSISSRGSGISSLTPHEKVVVTLGSTLDEMDHTTTPVYPAAFIAAVRECYKQFDDKQTIHGMAVYKQEDAEELYSCVLQSCANVLKTNGSSGSNSSGNLIDDLFGIELETVYTNAEADEPTQTRQELSRKLLCNIQGGIGSVEKIDHMHQGLLLGLEGTVEKFSSKLQKNSIWKKTQRISKLPKYLCIQYMRFYWKALPDDKESGGGVKCKIMRPVMFPTTIDIYEFCNSHIKGILEIPRAKMEEKILKGKEKKVDAMDALMEEEDNEDTNGGKKEDSTPNSSGETAGISLPSNFMGNYELFALCTHKGRNPDSGHYVGWTKSPQNNDSWYCFDDSSVEECKTENILQLKGGGDMDMAYLLFYRYKD